MDRIQNKIMLINTLPHLDYWKRTKEPQLGMPLGLLSIGTFLKSNGYAVTIIDPVVSKDYLDIIKDSIQGCLFVGLSVMTAGIASGLQISRYIRRLDGGIPILWGGVHATLLPEQTLQSDLVDFVCWGDGEDVCLKLADNLKRGMQTSGIEGLGGKWGGRIMVNKRSHFVHPDNLPLPDYSLLDMDKYLYRNVGTLTNVDWKAKVCVLNTGLGCPYKCRFCIATHPSQRFRSKSARRMMEEIDILVSQFDPDVIHIQDDLFFADRQRALEFINQYESKGYGFKWFTLARANYFNEDYISDAFIKRIKGSCLWLGLGIESGSDAMRRRLNKGITADQIDKAVDTLAKNGMKTGYAFMVGLPYETEEEMVETARMIFTIKKCHPQSVCAYQLFRPYPNTELFDDATKLGYMMPQSLEEWVSVQDPVTGYTTINELVWLSSKERLLANYLVNAISWAQTSARVHTGKRILDRLLYVAIVFLLKIPSIFSLKLRLRFNYWGCIIETWVYGMAYRVRTVIERIE